jgi:hypothetical protein
MPIAVLEPSPIQLLTPQNSPLSGVFQVFMDLSKMKMGDQAELVIKENGRAIYSSQFKGDNGIWVSPTLFTHNTDVEVRAISGTPEIEWQTRNFTSSIQGGPFNTLTYNTKKLA